jgi:hypothetical protein
MPTCAGTAAKTGKSCARKVKNEGDFCHHHKPAAAAPARTHRTVTFRAKFTVQTTGDETPKEVDPETKLSLLTQWLLDHCIDIANIYHAEDPTIEHIKDTTFSITYNLYDDRTNLDDEPDFINECLADPDDDGNYPITTADGTDLGLVSGRIIDDSCIIKDVFQE